MFFTIVFIAIILVIIMILLPYFSGLTKVELDTHHHGNKNKKQSIPIQQHQEQQYGYIPPDELYQQQHPDNDHHSKTSALKEKFQLTQEDMPIKIKLTDSEGLRKRKKEKLDLDTNPNNYDYDIDELIQEENINAKEEQQKEFYKNQPFGKEREEMV
ncbi:unnamed protein product [Candida verbasci]|uniref:Uncharacterized protein n=1 Tax=Candida verbasci TaxID=1227364 RepID=A0A9W4XB62_9ASCO|nr:unnamed protein product [Candida verbasci]